MRYQHSFKDVPPEEIPDANQRNLEATIRRALELGINHIETARGYGTSELQLGRFLHTIPREEHILQTKVFPSNDSAQFIDTFNLSMSNLGVDYVDLLSIHGINNKETLHNAIRSGGSVDMAKRFRNEGRCRFIGFSTHADSATIVEAIETGLFDYINLHWYYIFQENWQAVQLARQHDMGVFIISPNDKGGRLYDPPVSLSATCSPLTPMQFNSLFCLSRSEVHTLSIGAAKPSDFDDHIAGLEHLDSCADHVQAIDLTLRRQVIERLGDSWNSDWYFSLPGWEDTPGNINLRIIPWLWKCAKGWDLIEYAKMRYNLLGEGGHWFPGEKYQPALKSELTEFVKMIEPVSEDLAGTVLMLPEICEETHALLLSEKQKRLSQSD
jgi:predicted aldo/keto reductase-like oxidoreductase